MAEALALYYKSHGTAPTLLRRGNISGRPHCWTMTITLYHMYILYIYIYITHTINCLDGTVIYFTKTSEFITKLAWSLFVLRITKSYTYPFIYVFPLHYEYLRGLAILGEDVAGSDLGDCSGLDPCDLWGYGSHLAKNHVEGWRDYLRRYDRDFDLISPA